VKVIWAYAPLTASDVIARLTAQDPSWHPKTARTLLNRLVRRKPSRSVGILQRKG
jgi:BlaI family penicillinase repressor